MNHIIIGIFIRAIEVFLVIIISMWILKEILKKRRINMNIRSDKLLPVLYVIFISVNFIITPVDNMITRVMEKQADNFAIETTGDKKCTAILQCKLMESNLGVPDTNMFIKLWYSDHPTTRERVENANNFNFK